MTNLFKKSALAVALLAAAGVAQAATVVDIANPVGVSKQAVNDVSIAGSDVVLNQAIDYPVGTKITIEFSAGELSVPGDITDVTNAGPTTTAFDLVSATTNKLVFEVKTNTLLAGSPNATLTGYKFTSASLAGVTGITATVSVTAPTGALNFDPVDTGGNLTRTVLIAGDQFAGSATKNTYKINLASGRSLLTGDSPANKTVVFETKLTNRFSFATSSKESAEAAIKADVTGKKIKHTVTGDFSFVTDSNKDTIGIQAPKDAFTYSAGCAEVSLTTTELVYECDTQAAADGYDNDLKANAASQVTRSVSVDLAKAGASATAPLMNGTYKVTAVQNYGSSKTVNLLNGADIVVLEDNGTTKHVDYMPFGENISQIVYVTNLVEEAGKVRLTVWDEKGTKVANNVEVTTTVTKNGIIPLAGELKKIVGDKATGKYRFSVSLESSSATVYAAYRVGADAAYVVVR